MREGGGGVENNYNDSLLFESIIKKFILFTICIKLAISPTPLLFISSSRHLDDETMR